jgi:lactate dehydrogenase-like 2-hydroxyacid dehydrogenase
MPTETNTPWKVLVADGDYAASLAELRPNFPNLALIGVDAQHDLSSLATGEIAGLVVQHAAVDQPLLDKLSGLRVVLKNGRNYNNIDAAAVRARQLTFGCVPRKGPNCVAELAMTLILALSKDLFISHQSVVEGAYRLRGLRPEKTAERKIAFHWMKNGLVHEVRDKTLGILGMGEIGVELARRAAVMGMNIVYFKRTPLSPELEERFGAVYRSLPDLLGESDYVCIAMPHTAETERMIGRQELAWMKESAFLVNIARGGIVDEEALVEALAARRLAGAGLDVFTYEPLQADSPLCLLDNVILTPHIGGGTGTTRTQELAEALRELERILAGGSPLIDLSRN